MEEKELTRLILGQGKKVIEVAASKGISGGTVWEYISVRVKLEQPEFGKAYEFSIDLHLPNERQKEIGRFGSPLRNHHGIIHKQYPVGSFSSIDELRAEAIRIISFENEKRRQYYIKRREF